MRIKQLFSFWQSNPEKLYKQLPCGFLEDRLFSVAVMHGMCFEEHGRVEVVSTDCSIKTLLEEILATQRVDVSFSGNLDNVSDSKILFVDIDSLGGILGLIDQLLVLRIQNKSRLIILLSADFSSDDFDANRLWICDTSLRIPFSFARLEQALVQADINNMIWQDQKLWEGLPLWASRSQLVSS